MKNLVNYLFLTMICLLLTSGCARHIYKVAYPTLSDGKYDTEFPYKDGSRQLKEIARTIKKINAVAYYKSYILSQQARITRNDLINENWKNAVIEEIYFHESVLGTATIIYSDFQKIAFLTCAHIGDYPDTIITYFDQAGQELKFIQNIALLERAEFYVNDIQEVGKLELLAKDNKKDIAIFGKHYEKPIDRIIPVFDYPLGKSAELEWGSFVYVIGYPMGFQMITKGIVSRTSNIENSSFLIDALFNPGFSGGVVLAIKDGVPNFELVGMAKSVSAESEYILLPSQKSESFQYNPHLPYQGETFVRKKTNINYGVTYSVTAESIRDFFKEQRQVLERQGYYFQLD